MLVSLPGLLCLGEHRSFAPGKDPPVRTREASGQEGRGKTSHAVSRDVLLQKAGAFVQEAETLSRQQMEKSLVTAISRLQQAAQLFTTAGARQDAARAYISIGEIDFILSRYGQAVNSFQEAIKLADQKEQIRCPALSRIARVYATTGQLSNLGKDSRQAISLCAQLPDPLLRAEALEAQGEVGLNSSRYQEAAEQLRRASDDFAAAKDNNGQALALLQLSFALWYDDRSKALQAAVQALELWSADGNRYGVAQVLGALGTFASLTGEFETAQCNWKRARHTFNEIGDRDNEAVVLNVMGSVSLGTGDPDAALKYYQDAGRLFASVHDSLGGAEATTGMAKSLTALHQYERALPLYHAKLDFVIRTGNPTLEASALKDMAGVYAAEHRFAEAFELYRRSLARYRSVKHFSGQGDVLHAMARVQMTRGRYISAMSLLQSALELKNSETGTGQAVEVAEIQYEMADIYRRLYRPQDALTAIRQPIEFIETQRLSISEFDSRAAYFASVHRYYGLYIQVLMLLHEQSPQGNSAERAFAESEKSKVRSLIDLLTTSSHDAPCEELLKKQQEEASGVHTAGRTATSAAEAPSVLDLAQVQAEIGDQDTVLLEYALGDDKSYLWVVDQKRMVAHELPGMPEIESAAREFRDAVAPSPKKDDESAEVYQERLTRARRNYPRFAAQLSRLLLGPADLSKAKRVVIVPDGALQYIPFAALRLATATGQDEILIARHEVVVLPSVSVLSTLRKAAAKRAPPTKSAAIFADPIFRSDDERICPAHDACKGKRQELPAALTRAILDIHGSLYIPRLGRTRDEARNIQGSLGPNGVLLALDFEATRERILQSSLSDYKYVHFATHGIIDALHPEMSGLILSLIDERRRPIDGYLRLGDIYGLKLSADLVVLSACDSALGKDVASEGTIGLPRGFLYAGARSVIASLWKVDDTATAALMSALYERLGRGESISAALRGAQLEMAQRGHSPVDWAAFVLQGEYKQ